MIQETENETKIEVLDDLGENLNEMSVTSFHEAQKATKKTKAIRHLSPTNSILLPKYSRPNLQNYYEILYQRYQLYSWTRRKGNFSVLEEARFVYVSLKSKTKSP